MADVKKHRYKTASDPANEKARNQIAVELNSLIGIRKQEYGRKLKRTPKAFFLKMSALCAEAKRACVHDKLTFSAWIGDNVKGMSSAMIIHLARVGESGNPSAAMFRTDQSKYLPKTLRNTRTGEGELLINRWHRTTDNGKARILRRIIPDFPKLEKDIRGRVVKILKMAAIRYPELNFLEHFERDDEVPEFETILKLGMECYIKSRDQERKDRPSILPPTPQSSSPTTTSLPESSTV